MARADSVHSTPRTDSPGEFEQMRSGVYDLEGDINNLVCAAEIEQDLVYQCCQNPGDKDRIGRATVMMGMLADRIRDLRTKYYATFFPKQDEED